MANKTQQPGNVNFQDWLTQNQPQVDAMNNKVQGEQNNIQGYANQARSELSQAVKTKGEAGGWNGDYQGLDEFGHFKDSTNALNDYQLDNQTNNGRQMQLYNQYQGQATNADAALLHQRGQKQNADNQAPSGWNSYLNGLENTYSTANNTYNTNKAASDAAAAKANAAKNQQQADAAQAAKDEAARKAQYLKDHPPSYAGMSTTYGTGDINAAATNAVGQAANKGQAHDAVMATRPQEPANDGWSPGWDQAGKSIEEQNTEQTAREQRWAKYKSDLASWQAKHPGFS